MKTPNSHITPEILRLDPETEIEKIVSFLRRFILQKLGRRGFVVGLSGGVDSSTVAALCVLAAGRDGVLGLLMPEKESSPDSLELGRLAADTLGIRTEVVDITNILEAVGCYSVRDEAIRSVIPSYDSSHKCKLILPDLLKSDSYRLYSIVTQSLDGIQQKKRLSRNAYLGILSASNFKQRVRKMIEYYHADNLEYAVVGTPNRLEYDQGFFVKLGDGAADVKPIAHLYKTQVYQLAEHLGVPEEIRTRPSTTDTYSLPQSQEEFFFSLPHDTLDLCLYGHDHGIPADCVAEATGLTSEQVEKVNRDIEAKRKASRYLHSEPLLVEESPNA